MPKFKRINPVLHTLQVLLLLLVFPELSLSNNQQNVEASIQENQDLEHNLTLSDGEEEASTHNQEAQHETLQTSTLTVIATSKGDGRVVALNDTNLERLLAITPPQFLLVQFFSEWCPFSAQIVPAYSALAQTFPQLTVAAIDATKYPSACRAHSVYGYPTLILFKGDQEVDLYQGNNTYPSLLSFVQQHTGLQPEEGRLEAKDEGSGEGESYAQFRMGSTDLCLVAASVFVAALATQQCLLPLWRRLAQHHKQD